MTNFRLKCAIIFSIIVLSALTIYAQDGNYATSSDNLVKIKIPAGWTSMKLNDEAVLQYGNENKSTYLLILNDTKEDIEGWNIKKHSFITLAKLLSGVNSPIIEGPLNITVNGFQGIQYTIKGSVDGQMIMYIHTTFETPDTFVQLLAWTLPSQYEKNKSMMEGIINSFKSAK